MSVFTQRYIYLSQMTKNVFGCAPVCMCYKRSRSVFLIKAVLVPSILQCDCVLLHNEGC